MPTLGMAYLQCWGAANIPFSADLTNSEMEFFLTIGGYLGYSNYLMFPVDADYSTGTWVEDQEYANNLYNIFGNYTSPSFFDYYTDYWYYWYYW